MKNVLFFVLLLSSFSAYSQHEEDSVYSKCPVSIKDTVTGNNYFIEHLPATVKTYRRNGHYTIVIEQKKQYFTIFFQTRKLSTKGKYSILIDANNNKEASVKYSFRSGDDVAFIDVSSGKIETTYDKASKLWHIRLTGLIANMGSSSVTYFKAVADFYVR